MRSLRSNNNLQVLHLLGGSDDVVKNDHVHLADLKE